LYRPLSTPTSSKLPPQPFDIHVLLSRSCRATILLSLHSTISKSSCDKIAQPRLNFTSLQTPVSAVSLTSSDQQVVVRRYCSAYTRLLLHPNIPSQPFFITSYNHKVIVQQLSLHSLLIHQTILSRPVFYKSYNQQVILRPLNLYSTSPPPKLPSQPFL
jgi:hypothetical protein